MNANDYQTEAIRTLIYKPDFEIQGRDFMMVWVALGLTGEAGEVGEHIKKGILHQHGLDRDKLIEEIGDVCWYIASLCELINVPLEYVLQYNIQKLKRRYPNGYDPGDSKSRRDK